MATILALRVPKSTQFIPLHVPNAGLFWRCLFLYQGNVPLPKTSSKKILEHGSDGTALSLGKVAQFPDRNLTVQSGEFHAQQRRSLLAGSQIGEREGD